MSSEIILNELSISLGLYVLWNMHGFIFVNVREHCMEKIGCPFKSPSGSCIQLCTGKFKPDSFVCHLVSSFSASGNTARSCGCFSFLIVYCSCTLGTLNSLSQNYIQSPTLDLEQEIKELTLSLVLH